MANLKPKQRTQLRIFLGKKYFRMKRYLNWYFGEQTFARTQDTKEKLPHPVFEHRTPLLRKLQHVEMWLQHNKVNNLKLAIARLHGVMLRPGETFSYWRLIGNPTRRKGYQEGMILFYGQVKTGIGGGLCQCSNLIYWLTLHTPLTVTERYRHSYDVFPDVKRNQPFGSGATCAYNYLDLQIKNETNQTYQLVLYMTDTHLVGEWRIDTPATKVYEVYEQDHWITHEFWGGYVRHNRIHRKVFNVLGEQLDDEFVTENHAIMMYEPLLQQKSEGEAQ